MGLLACALGSAWPASLARAEAPVRIVALDWTATAMLLSIGMLPVGVGDAGLYRIWVREPALPEGTPDMGLRDAPNPEIVAALNPDLILISPLGGASRPLLERIAPTREISLQRGQGDALAQAGQELLSLARLLGREDRAKALVATSEAKLAAIRGRLAGQASRRVLVIQFLDARFVRIYGRSSLPGAVLDRLGLVNAWTQAVNDWGFALTGIERLAALPDMDVVVVDPLPAEVSLAPSADSLWGNLPAVRQGRVSRMPAVWTFGEITAADRFADLLVDRLLPERNNARL